MTVTGELTLPQYKCHKIVGAVKISEVSPVYTGDDERAGTHTLFIEDRNGISVNAKWVEKHQPKAGGYFVSYDGGYTSYSPADAFESGYRVMDPRTELDEAGNPKGNDGGKLASEIQPDWMQRVVGEKAELQDKYDKILDFIQSSEMYKLLAEKDRSLLSDQVNAMEAYGDILDARIESFSESVARLPEDIAATGPAPDVQPYGHTVDEGDCRNIAN